MKKNMKHELNRGVIGDSAIAAMVTSPLFKVRVEKSKKGKGSFARQAKHKGRKEYSKAI